MEARKQFECLRFTRAERKRDSSPRLLLMGEVQSSPMEEFDRSSGFEAGLVRSSGELLTRSALTPDDVRLVDVIRNEDRISEAERRIFIFENSVKKCCQGTESA